MKSSRYVASTALAAAVLSTLLLTNGASAQFPRLPGIDPRRTAIDGAARQLAPYIAEQTPIRLDPVELYPTVDDLAGGPFAPTAAPRAIDSIVAQLRQSTTGTVSLAPGDYSVAVRLFCMSHSRPARAPLAFLLGPMRGRRAPAIVALNSRAASSTYAWSPLQGTSWTIQGGLAYGDFPVQFKTIVDSLIPDYTNDLNVSTLDDIQHRWSAVSNVSGAPSLDSVLGQLGPAGQTIVEMRTERSQILSQASDFEALRRTFAPVQTADVAALATPWSVVSPAVAMRMLTRGHYGDVGDVQIRVSGTTAATVPLVSSIAYGRCTPAITTQGSAYACTQPLSFMPIRTSAVQPVR